MNTICNHFKVLYGCCLVTVAMIAPAYTKAQQENVEPKKQNEPKVHIDVNKEYDKNGNVIRYDSTYSWSWSNFDTSGTSTQFFYKHGLNDNFFGNNAFPDSDFFNNGTFPGFSDSLFFDPFGKHFEENFMNMEKIMEEQMKMMDEIQLKFFESPPDSYPEQNEEEKLKEKSKAKTISM